MKCYCMVVKDGWLWACCLILQQFCQLKVQLKLLFSGSNKVWVSEVQIISSLIVICSTWLTGDESRRHGWIVLLCCAAGILSDMQSAWVTHWMENSDAIKDEFIPLLLWLCCCVVVLLLKYNIQCFAHHKSTTFLSFNHFTYRRGLSCCLKNGFQYFCLLNTWVFCCLFFHC